MTEPSPATSSVLLCDFSQKSLPSGAFFSLRCLIYKVHAVPGGTLLILQNLFEFVKYFFQKFLMFSTQFCTFSNFLSYHNQLALSRTFLKVFNIVRCKLEWQLLISYHTLWLLSSVFSSTLWRSAYRADSFVRIPKAVQKVNPLFRALSTFSFAFLFFPISWKLFTIFLNVSDIYY